MQLDQLAAQAREDYLAAPARHLRRGRAERDADRDRAERVGQVVASANGNVEVVLAVGVPIRRLGDALGDRALEREHVAAGAEGEQRRQLVAQVRLERLGVGRDDRASPSREAVEDLRLRLGDRLERAPAARGGRGRRW